MNGMFAVVLAVRLVGAGGIPRSVLERAETVAGAIFAKAGVRVEWIDCRNARCASMAGPWIEFVEQSQGAAGYTVIVDRTSSYAVVRYPVVEQAAASLESDPAPLLGATIAHELGHVLLGKSHARRGVMSARLGRTEIGLAARGDLQFTAAEAKKLSEAPPAIAAR